MYSDGDGLISASYIHGVTSLNVSSKSITSLEGIEFFTGLKTLDCSQNPIVNLDLTNNTALISVDAWGTSGKLASIDVTHCLNLEHLEVKHF